MKSSRYVGVFGTKSKYVSSSKYSIKVTVAPRTAIVLRASSQLPGLTTAPRPAVSVAPDFMTSSAMISATVSSKSKDPLSVTFLARTDSSAQWRVIGSDDSPTGSTFKLILDDWVWTNPTMEFAAITRTSNGQTAGSLVLRINRADVDLHYVP